MGNLIIALFLFSVIAIFLGVLFIWRRKLDRDNEFKKVNFAIFVIGMCGWTIALLIRLIPLQLLQLGTLFLLGADLTNTASFEPFLTNFWVIWWGPLLAGIVEGGTRYFCFVLYKKSKNDPKNSAFFLGIGWTLAEIVVVYFIPLIAVVVSNTPQLVFGDSLIGLYERLIASVAHIIFSYFAFYALFEAKNRKISLILAMGWHFLLDFMIVLWIIAFSNLAVSNPYLYILSLEGAITLVVLVAIVFWIKFWFPRCKATMQTYIENRNKPPEFKPPTTIDDIKIDSGVFNK